MNDIVKRLREYAGDDHERGCQGRYYDCSCGYDDKRDPLMTEAATEITVLRAEVEKMREMQRTVLVEQGKDVARLRAENERLRAIIKACQWYWDSEDAEFCYSDPWEVVDDLDDGDIRKVWRGGKVETMFVAKVGDELVDEPTLDAAEAKVSELQARAALTPAPEKGGE